MGCSPFPLPCWGLSATFAHASKNQPNETSSLGPIAPQEEQPQGNARIVVLPSSPTMAGGTEVGFLRNVHMHTCRVASHLRPHRSSTWEEQRGGFSGWSKRLKDPASPLSPAASPQPHQYPTWPSHHQPIVAH